MIPDICYSNKNSNKKMTVEGMMTGLWNNLPVENDSNQKVSDQPHGVLCDYPSVTRVFIPLEL